MLRLRSWLARFADYLSPSQIEVGLQSGELVQGKMRVAAFQTDAATVKVKSGGSLPLKGFISRNRAMDGDTVVANVAKQAVVGIINRKNSRLLAKITPDNRRAQPRDQRLPAMILPTPLTVDEITNLSRYPVKTHSAFWALVDVKEWRADCVDGPDAQVAHILGSEGDFAAVEIDALLEFYGLDTSPFPEHLEICTPKPDGNRLDLTDLAIFSIDPETARDLDDAISAVKNEKSIRVGVHVADVSHFVLENSMLDAEARKRATTVYLPQKVYPMLPRQLSEDLCSLLPHRDRFTFTVFFSLTPRGSVIPGTVQFVKTLIRSQSRLTYNQADAFLSGGCGSGLGGVAEQLGLLNRVTRRRRQSRRNELISFARTETWKFKFDAEGLPESINPTDLHAGFGSHEVIEELMVLANQLVAERLATISAAGAVALLRRHERSAEAAELLRAALRDVGREDLVTEDSSASQLLSTAQKHLSKSLYLSVSGALLQNLNEAEYVPLAAGEVGDNHEHWALGLKRYMHFTSPIRRYADIIAHRLLAASLEGKDAGILESDLKKEIDICNKKKRDAEDAEIDVFNMNLGLLLRRSGKPIDVDDCVVTKIHLPVHEDDDRVKSGELKPTIGAVSVYVPLADQTKSISFRAMEAEFILGTESEIQLQSIPSKDAIVIRLGQDVRAQIVLANTSKPDTTLPQWTIRLVL